MVRLLVVGLVLGFLVGCDRPPVTDPPAPVVGKAGKADFPDGPDPCVETVMCEVWGRCTTDPAADDCVVGSDDECQQSLFCGNSGHCTRVQTQTGGFECRPGSDGDCKQAEVCALFRQCRFYPDHTCGE
jgi:hypothetical protein